MPIAFSCPYYKSDRKLKLNCELESIYFENMDQKKRFIKKNCCCENWRSCENAKMLNSYYDGKYREKRK